MTPCQSVNSYTKRVAASDRIGAPLSMSHGFTLIELLVVVAIIALLAAILYPAFERAQENAMRTTCQSNMKQIALGTIQYLQDYDNIYPHEGGQGLNNYGYATCVGAVTGTWSDWGDPNAWPTAIMPYVGNQAGGTDTNIFMCPSDTRLLTYPNTNCDYGHNWYLAVYKSNEVAPQSATAESQVNSPAATIMWYEQNAVGTSAGNMINCSDYSTYFYNGCCKQIANTRHLEAGSNYSFCDGHVKYYPGLQMFNACSGGTYTTPSAYGACAVQDGISWFPSY